MTEGFIAAGHTVAACARNPQHIRELQQAHPAPSHFAAVDVADADAVAHWAEEVVARVGVPDLIINNAAVIHANASFEAIPPTEVRRVLAINVEGTCNVIRAWLPQLRAHGRGMIVNMSSGAGRNGYAEISIYCASKWAIEGLTKAIAAELPPSLGIVALSPGVVNTDMLQSTFGPEDAAACIDPAAWAAHAVPFILSLGPQNNGESLTTPHAHIKP